MSVSTAESVGKLSSDFRSLVERLVAEHERILDENSCLRKTSSAPGPRSSATPTLVSGSVGTGSGARRVHADAGGGGEGMVAEGSAPGSASAGGSQPRVSFSGAHVLGEEWDSGSEGSGAIVARTSFRSWLGGRRTSERRTSEISNRSPCPSARSQRSQSSLARCATDGWTFRHRRDLEKDMESAMHNEMQEMLYERFGLVRGGEDITVTADRLAEILGTCSFEPFPAKQLDALIIALQSLAPQSGSTACSEAPRSFGFPISRMASASADSMSLVPTISAMALVKLLVSDETYWSIPEHLRPIFERVQKCLTTETQDVHHVIAKLLAQTTTGAHSSDFWQEATHNISKPDVVFKVFSGFVVILSSVLVGVATAIDWEGWPIVEAVIAVYFLAELLYKLKTSGCREHLTGPERYWNTFDAIVTFVSLADAAVYVASASAASGGGSFKVLRMLRLVRAIRVLRLLRMPVMKQLTLLLDGVEEGMRILFWAGLLLAVLFYILAVSLTQITSSSSLDGGEATPMFSSVPRAMDTLFRCLIASECTTPSGQPVAALMAQAYGWAFVLGHWMVVAIMNFGINNLINAMFVENTIAAARVNQEKQRRRTLNETRRVAKIMLRLVNFYVLAASQAAAKRNSSRETSRIFAGRVPRRVFCEVNDDPEVHGMYDELGIPDEDRDNLFDNLDADGNGELSVSEIVQGLLNLRGPARRSDSLAIKMVLRNMQKSSREFYLVALRHMDMLEEAQQNLIAKVGELSGEIQAASCPASSCNEPDVCGI